MLRQLEGRLRVGQIALRLVTLAWKTAGSICATTWPAFTWRIKIDEQFLDVAGNLAADLHVHDRIERAGRGHGLGDRARASRWPFDNSASPLARRSGGKREKRSNDEQCRTDRPTDDSVS